ncbi:hypothetical protein [Halorussus amylolyticus]|uniref:hypothetical protein n=1 Tax=Halorussus amylolyticus TaxID=1126242 RepID=UPI0010437102|nr:hypothetical protein [Halorussus amylolyticus]
MALKDTVPKPLRGPIGFGSLGVMILGLVVGYIFTMVGITLYFGMGDPAEALSAFESIVVGLVGVACIVVGYLGWKSFNYFAY